MEVVGIPELEVVGSLELDDIMAEFELIISRCSTVSKSFAVAWNCFFTDHICSKKLTKLDRQNRKTPVVNFTMENYL